VGAQWRKEVEILPLGVRERRAFLAHRLSERDAEALAIHIEASASLRGLAGSPLLLALMAELGLPLPESRVTFYERTEARLGARRSQVPQHDLVWARSGAVLDRLADEMKLNRIEAPLALLMDACASDQPLYDALRSSGILTIDRDRACFAGNLCARPGQERAAGRCAEPVDVRGRAGNLDARLAQGGAAGRCAEPVDARGGAGNLDARLAQGGAAGRCAEPVDARGGAGNLDARLAQGGAEHRRVEPLDPA